MSEVLLLLSKIPTEAFPAVGRVLAALLSGDHAAAEREARVASETIAAKRIVHASYEAGKRGDGAGE